MSYYYFPFLVTFLLCAFSWLRKWRKTGDPVLYSKQICRNEVPPSHVSHITWSGYKGYHWVLPESCLNEHASKLSCFFRAKRHDFYKVHLVNQYSPWRFLRRSKERFWGTVYCTIYNIATTKRRNSRSLQFSLRYIQVLFGRFVFLSNIWWQLFLHCLSQLVKFKTPKENSNFVGSSCSWPATGRSWFQYEYTWKPDVRDI